MPIFFKKAHPQQRLRGNRIIGRIGLIVVFICLATMNIAVGAAIMPYIGDYADPFKAVLFLDTIWTAILLVAIWKRQGWARVVLVIFLFGFVALQLIYLPEIIQVHPHFKENCLRVAALHWATHVAAAIYLLASADVRWLARDEIND